MLLNMGETTPPCGVPARWEAFPRPEQPALSIARSDAALVRPRFAWATRVKSFSWSTDPKEIFQIGIDDPLWPLFISFQILRSGILGRSSSPVSEAGIIEHRLEDRLQPVQQRLLAYPVINRRDAQAGETLPGCPALGIRCCRTGRG